MVLCILYIIFFHYFCTRYSRVSILEALLLQSKLTLFIKIYSMYSKEELLSKKMSELEDIAKTLGAEYDGDNIEELVYSILDKQAIDEGTKNPLGQKKKRTRIVKKDTDRVYSVKGKDGENFDVKNNKVTSSEQPSLFKEVEDTTAETEAEEPAKPKKRGRKSKKEKEAEAERKAAEAEKEALDKNSDAKEKNAEATGKAAKRTHYLYDTTNLTTEAINNLDEALNRMNGNTILGTKGVIDMWAKQANAAAEYVADVNRAVAATDRLTQKISDGTVSMQDIAEATHAASSRIAQLDGTTLNNLHAAIDEARQKLKELEDQARDSADSLEAELAQLRGDDSKTAALEQERKIRELNAKLHEAELRNNAEEIAQYRRALDLQQQIGREKQQQAAAKKAEEQQRRQQQQQQASGDNGRGSNGGNISAGQVADAWDDRIRAAERRGAQNFANELYNEARRRR